MRISISKHSVRRFIERWGGTANVNHCYSEVKTQLRSARRVSLSTSKTAEGKKVFKYYVDKGQVILSKDLDESGNKIYRIHTLIGKKDV